MPARRHPAGSCVLPADHALKPATNGFRQDIAQSPAYDNLKTCLEAYYSALESEEGTWLTTSPQSQRVVHTPAPAGQHAEPDHGNLAVCGRSECAAEERIAGGALPPWGMSAAELADAEAAALLAWYPLVQAARAVIYIFEAAHPMHPQESGKEHLAAPSHWRLTVGDLLKLWAGGKPISAPITPPWVIGQPALPDRELADSADNLLGVLADLNVTGAMQRRALQSVRSPSEEGGPRVCQLCY